jgi:uncharacterized membrane protein (UPF0127 family)
MRRYAILVALAALLLLAAAALFVFHPRPAVREWGIGNPNPSVMIGGEKVSVALAVTDAQRAQGLSGTAPLKADEGMLFVFPEDGLYRFWMKGMKYAIDIIWIDADGRIVYIAPSLSPDTYPNSYGPDVPSRYVLEVSAGFASAHAVRVGDRVGF